MFGTWYWNIRFWGLRDPERWRYLDGLLGNGHEPKERKEKGQGKHPKARGGGRGGAPGARREEVFADTIVAQRRLRAGVVESSTFGGE